MNYTKGPWISGYVESGWGLIAKESGKCIVFAETQDGGTVPLEVDAKVMEAAPDLLEACKALIDLANENEVKPRSRDWQIFQALLKASNAGILAKTAIAKAEGKK